MLVLSLVISQDAEDRSIANLVQQALASSVRLDLLPKSVIDIFITVVECDGIESCVAAATVAASTSLAKAGIEMLGLVVSCAGVSPRHRQFLYLLTLELSGCRWRGYMVGSYGRRGAVSIWTVAVRMYALSRLDDKRLADWSHTSDQGVSGGRQLITLRRFVDQFKITSGPSTMSRALYRHPSNGSPGSS